MSVKEGAVEKGVVEWAKDNGWMTYKLGGLGDKGKPDRVFLYTGRQTVFIEFKAPGGTPSKLQQWHITELAKRGYTVYVVDEKERGIEILKAIGEPYARID